jgi:hypothetical protein
LLIEDPPKKYCQVKALGDLLYGDNLCAVSAFGVRFPAGVQAWRVYVFLFCLSEPVLLLNFASDLTLVILLRDCQSNSLQMCSGGFVSQT